MNVEVPNSVRSCLWSYDVDRMDFNRDKNLVITQILNYGGTEAVQWMRERYSSNDIYSQIARPMRGIWKQKSLNYWSLIYGVVTQ